MDGGYRRIPLKTQTPPLHWGEGSITPVGEDAPLTYSTIPLSSFPFSRESTLTSSPVCGGRLRWGSSRAMPPPRATPRTATAQSNKIRRTAPRRSIRRGDPLWPPGGERGGKSSPTNTRDATNRALCHVPLDSRFPGNDGVVGNIAARTKSPHPYSNIHRPLATNR